MVFATATSGLLHHEQRLEASAHNSANLQTRQTAVLSVSGREIPGAGVRSVVSATPVTRPQIPGPSASPASDPPGEGPVQEPRGLVFEAVEQITLLQHSIAQARVVQTQDDMRGTLLDITG